MAEPKTKPTKASVDQFIDAQEKESVRDDCRTLVKLMQEISGEPPVMWGTSIVGFGTYHYHYASGTEGDWPVLAFSPRKQNLTIYFMDGFKGKAKELAKLGKNKTSVSCLYVKGLEGLHLPTLRKMIADTYRYMVKTYPVKSQKG
ncbi:MAG: DUF1801 domain-containing protein [Cyclobacteriaceae bacterium]|nr:DUF1801 domain-containing protein [Cyclobacteriaceae bacterium]